MKIDSEKLRRQILAQPDGCFELRGKVMHYDWGGNQLIPRWLGMDPEPGVPYAEYWLGAHPKAPSDIQIAGEWYPLDQAIHACPELMLGERWAQGGELPILVKLLDVARPLSIQVHPTKAQAEEGFAREEAAGIPIDAPERNFKDRNDKPEMVVALGEFWALQGIRETGDALEVMEPYSALSELSQQVQDHGGGQGFSFLLQASDVTRRKWVAALRKELPRQSGMEKPAYWINHLLDLGTPESDRGLLAFFLMNIVRLEKDQALYQAPNVPHAYLRGPCIEIMTNSDNVIRAGLTGKHVDVPLLLEIANLCPCPPAPVQAGEVGRYEVSEQRILFQNGAASLAGGPAITITHGRAKYYKPSI